MLSFRFDFYLKDQSLFKEKHSRSFVKMSRRNSRKILSQNGSTDSKNDSINVYTFGIGFWLSGAADYRSERVKEELSQNSRINSQDLAGRC